MPSDALSNTLAQIERERPFHDTRACCTALHDFVRDEIAFGFSRGFEAMSPEQTLRARRGHCNVQADLLCALLRRAGVPARLRFVRLDKEVLYQAIPKTAFACLPPTLLHAVTQVKVDDRWLHSDSYVFQPAVFDRYQQRLAESGRSSGFGLTTGATCSWDARHDAFTQTRPADLHRDDPTFSSLAEAVAEGAGSTNLLGAHFNHWFSCIPAFLQPACETYLSRELGAER